MGVFKHEVLHKGREELNSPSLVNGIEHHLEARPNGGLSPCARMKLTHSIV